MPINPEIEYCGLVSYAEMLERQRELFAEMVADKRSGLHPDEHIFVVEHPTVITLGRRAKVSNLLATPEALNAMGVEYMEIERGGDVTCHEPGQVVVYPLIDLEAHKLGVKQYVHLLEEAVIQTLANYGIATGRVDGATGVWIDIGTPNERKICAIGVKISRYVSMHGLAMNVCNSLEGFKLINPCGFIDKGVTTLHRELEMRGDDLRPTTEEVGHKLAENLVGLLNHFC